MPVTRGPDLSKYMDKRLNIKLNAGRRVAGVLRGFDAFMNLVIDEAEEFVDESQVLTLGQAVIRGNSVIQVECLERV